MPASHVRASAPVAVPAVAKKVFTSAPYVLGGLVVLALLAAIPPQTHQEMMPEQTSKAAMLPQISVTPQADDAVVTGSAVAKTKTETTLAMNSAQTLPVLAVIPPKTANMTDGIIGKTIVLKGVNESIIGQMARIPLENEQITEIKSVSDIDNSAGRELLSIINKY